MSKTPTEDRIYILIFFLRHYRFFLQRALPLLWLAVFCLAGCSVDIEIYDKTLKSNPVDFTNAENFEFDTNFVELIDGRIQLKALDLEHSEADFISGTHVGSSLNSSNLMTLQHKPTNTVTDVNKIIPIRSSNLVGYWRMDGNWLDSTALAQHGDPTIATSFSASSKLGSHSATFDGSQAGVSFGDLNTIDFQTNNFSLSFWVKGGSGLGGALLAKDIWAGNGNGLIVYWEGGTYRYWNGTTFIPFGSTCSEWCHVAVIRNSTAASGVDFYFNGLLVGTITDSRNLTNAIPFYIGGTDSNNHFNGELDEVSLWNTNLTPEEVFSLYESQNENFINLSELWTPEFSNIVGHWKMDGNWQDSSVNSNHGARRGSTSAAANFSNLAKVGGQSGIFNGSDGVIDISLPDINQFTIAFWLKVDSVDNSSPRIFRSPSIEVRINSSSGTPISIDSKATGANGLWRTDQDVIDLTKWAHWVISYDGLNLTDAPKVFKNGLELNTNLVSVPSGVLVDTDSGLTYIGNIASQTRSLTGNLDDLSIWNKLLTTADILKLYHRQKQKYAGHYDSEVINLGSTSSIWTDLSWSTNLPFGKEVVGDFDKDGNPDSESSSDYSTLTGDLSNGLVGHWGLNETLLDSYSGGADFKDNSGLTNNGSETGGVTTSVAGRLSNAVKFDGVDDYIHFGQTAQHNLVDNMTLSMWIYQELSGSYQSLLTKRSTATDYPFAFFLNNTTPANLRLYVRSGGPEPSVTSTSTVPLNVWTHVVVTRSENEIRFFINGAEDAGNPQTLAKGSSVPLADLVGGAQNFGSYGYYFGGAMDEVGIWNRPLSSNEVQQLYRRGANRIKFQVKSCVDSSCNCQSFNGSPIGTSNDCDGDGTTNDQDSDDIYFAEFMGPGGDSSTHYSEIFNRNSSDLEYDCSLNTTDSQINICFDDEFTLSGSPKPTSPLFNFEDFTDAAQPAANRYFQYRVTMEADENKACSGEPCLPELTSVNLNPEGPTKYYGQVQTVTTKNPVPYTFIKSATLDADSCASFQVSNDGTNYYIWDTDKWRTPSSFDEGISASDVTSNLAQFASQLGPGNLYLKAIMTSDTSTPCSFENFSMESSELQ